MNDDELRDDLGRDIERALASTRAHGSSVPTRTARDAQGRARRRQLVRSALTITIVVVVGGAGVFEIQRGDHSPTVALRSSVSTSPWCPQGVAPSHDTPASTPSDVVVRFAGKTYATSELGPTTGTLGAQVGEVCDRQPEGLVPGTPIYRVAGYTEPAAIGVRVDGAVGVLTSSLPSPYLGTDVFDFETPHSAPFDSFDVTPERGNGGPTRAVTEHVAVNDMVKSLLEGRSRPRSVSSSSSPGPISGGPGPGPEYVVTLHRHDGAIVQVQVDETGWTGALLLPTPIIPSLAHWYAAAGAA